MGAASVDWGVASFNTSYHPVKKRIGKRLDWVAEEFQRPIKN